MSVALLSLIGFAAWTLALAAVVVSYRTLLVLSGKHPANSWTRGSAIPSPALITRMEHAHLNCIENLPVFAVVVLVEVAMNQAAVIAVLAPWVLAARVAQSLTHLVGVSHWLVFVRASFYTVQVALMFWMMIQLAVA